MEAVKSGGAACASVVSQQYKAAIVLVLQAGMSLTSGIRAEADFRPRGMAVLVVFSCSAMGYK